MMVLPFVTLHLALPRLPLPCVAYQIHCFANTVSAYKPRSTFIASWLSPFCYMALKHGPLPRRSPPPRRVQHALSKAPPACVLATATKASVNAPNNQLHHLSYDNAAYAGSDISAAYNPPSLYEESMTYMTSSQTSMAGKDLEAAQKLDGASTPSMLPKLSLTTPMEGLC